VRIESNDPEDNENTRQLKWKIRDLLQKCKFLAKGIKTSRPTRCLMSPEPALLGKEFADKMARLYISRFESVFRILHIPSFWTEYEQYWRDPADAADGVKFTIQLVIAIGCSLYRDPLDSDQVCSAMSQWVYAAQAWLSAPMEKDRLSIRGLQVQCLLILARQILSVSGDLIWISMGTLLRTAMQLGLHRDPKHFTKMSLL
jgi:Fungal specific transcription factor domain